MREKPKPELWAKVLAWAAAAENPPPFTRAELSRRNIICNICNMTSAELESSKSNANATVSKLEA